MLSGNVPWADLSDEDFSFLTASHANHLSALCVFWFCFFPGWFVGQRGGAVASQLLPDSSCCDACSQLHCSRVLTTLLCQELCDVDGGAGDAQAEHKLVSYTLWWCPLCCDGFSMLFTFCFRDQAMDDLDALTAWILSDATEDILP